MIDQPSEQGPTPEDKNGQSGKWKPRFQVLVLVLCLLAPSVWMFATVPPLWRDVDAYKQLTVHPARSARNGHGPLYCVAVRIPLFVGYQFERLSGRANATAQNFYSAPTLTDTGINLLIGAQHLALGGAALALIMAAARPFWLRLASAVFFASTPLFYTFAHCVSSETLSMVLLLLFALSGLRIIRNDGVGGWRLWWPFALALYAAVLARHANMLLAFVLPAAFALSISRRQFTRAWRGALIALVVGLVSVGLARLSTAAFCSASDLPYYARPGFTFLWRLPFLHDVPEPVRAALLDRVAARARTEDARTLIALIRQILNEGGPLNFGTMGPRARVELAKTGPTRKIAQRVDFALNEVSRAFLIPPTPELLAAAEKDFRNGLTISLRGTAAFLFEMTAWYFENPAKLPQCAQLRTFRDYTPATLREILAQNPYLYSLGRFSLNGCLIAWLVLSLAVLIPRQQSANRLCAYSAALVTIGLAMLGFTCLIGEFLPRYTLPLWKLLWIAFLLNAGAIADAVPVIATPRGRKSRD